MSIFNFLLGRHGKNLDGSSPERAIIVDGVVEEYLWIQRHCSGFQSKRQLLKEIKGKPFDVHILFNKEGKERTIYFDISGFHS